MISSGLLITDGIRFLAELPLYQSPIDHGYDLPKGHVGPFNVGFRIGGTGLLVDSFLYGSVHVLAEFDFGVADFDPAIMRFVVRGGIGVNRPIYGIICINFKHFCRHSLCSYSLYSLARIET